MVLFSFIISSAIGSLAGIIIAPLTMTSYDVGIMLGLKGFCAAIIGGMSSGLGTVVGGLLLGILESLGAGLISARLQRRHRVYHSVVHPLHPARRDLRKERNGKGMMSIDIDNERKEKTCLFL